jgi:hypothetical protein
MPSLLRFREYVEAANLARHRAQSERNLHTKQILQEIERSYHRLIEIEKWMVDQQQYNRPFAHFGLFTLRGPPCARTSFPVRQIKNGALGKTTRAGLAKAKVINGRD